MKKIISIILLMLMMMSLSITVCAADGPVLSITGKDEINGVATIKISNVSEQYTIYKIINLKETKVTTVSTSSEFRIPVGAVSCTEVTHITINAVSSNGIVKSKLEFTMEGAHKEGDWQTVNKPSCTSNGKAEKKCKVCGKVIDTKILEATGHKWRNPSWTWGNEGKEVTAHFVCFNDDSHTKTITTTQVLTETKPSTCATPGQKVYKAKIELDGETYETSKTFTTYKTGHKGSDWVIDTPAGCETVGKKVQKCSTCGKVIKSETIPATGHDYTVSYSWSLDMTSCTATGTCSHDKNHIIKETVKASERVITKATCNTTGEIEKKASFKNPIFKTQTKATTVVSGHTDENKDNICDICKEKLVPDVDVTTTTKAEKTTIIKEETTVVEDSSSLDKPDIGNIPEDMEDKTDLPNIVAKKDKKVINPEKNTKDRKKDTVIIITVTVFIAITLGVCSGYLVFNKDKFFKKKPEQNQEGIKKEEKNNS